MDRIGPAPTIATAAEGIVTAALAEADPTLCNLKITLAHHRLSGALRSITGIDAGANFHTWAVWGSRKAGVTIRQEDLGGALRDATLVAGIVGAIVGVVAGWFLSAEFLGTSGSTLWALPLAGAAIGAAAGAPVGRALARWSRREASRLILEGNRIVLEDIGAATARFVTIFADQPPKGSALATFIDSLRPGPTEAGGQDLLRAAFTHYAVAATGEDEVQRRQACYHANCLAILHEHIRLQPYIGRSMPLIVRRCVTQRMMVFDVGEHELAVSQAVPALDPLVFPPDLVELRDPALRTFLTGPSGWDRGAESDLHHTAATDWTDLKQRMRYIVNLFRVMHLDEAVAAVPYGEQQVAMIDAGQVPPDAVGPTRGGPR